jgi:hypothetical protein
MRSRLVLRRVTATLVVGLVAGTPLAAQSAERTESPVPVTGQVFEDQNRNGVRDAGEPTMAGVAISDQVQVVRTDAQGRFAFEAAGYGFVSVTQPAGFAVRGPFWRRVAAGEDMAFPLVRVGETTSFAFIHASDTHISEASVERTRRLRTLADSIKPAFVLITGDLVRDALRVGEETARELYEMFEREIALFTVPVYTIPGNHEIFGIERANSLVSPKHPLYGKRMYRHYLGPDYYSFGWGGVHFVGLNSVDYNDTEYHGHVDDLQMKWLERDLATIGGDTPVVTFNHIPFVSTGPVLYGMDENSVAPTVIRIRGTPQFRHSVYNKDEVLDLIGDRLSIALGGHFHRHERVLYETSRGLKRFYQTAAVVGPPVGAGPVGNVSGVTLYRVRDRVVDDGTFIRLDP